jgi:DNA-binding transcriptional regulator GbsR (MarR family)
MSDRFKSLMNTLDKDTSLGLGMVVLIMGFLLRFVSPIEVFVDLWLFSVMGTVVLALGLLLIVAGLIRFLTDRDGVHPLGRLISRKDFERKYSEIGLADSSTSVKTIETLAKTKKPMNKKEIAHESGVSSSQVAQAIKSFVKKGFVTELQVRTSSYYVLAEKGVKFSQDLEVANQKRDIAPSVNVERKLRGSWLKRKLHEHQTAHSDKMPISVKEKILREQIVLISGFLGGLFIHFGVCFGVFSLSPQGQTIPFLLTLTAFAWLAATILCAQKVVGRFGVITLTMAWMSGFMVANGDPFTTLGVTVLMSSVGIGAFAELYS